MKSSGRSREYRFNSDPVKSRINDRFIERGIKRHRLDRNCYGHTLFVIHRSRVSNFTMAGLIIFTAPRQALLTCQCALETIYSVGLAMQIHRTIVTVGHQNATTVLAASACHLSGLISVTMIGKSPVS